MPIPGAPHGAFQSEIIDFVVRIDERIGRLNSRQSITRRVTEIGVFRPQVAMAFDDAAIGDAAFDLWSECFERAVYGVQHRGGMIMLRATGRACVASADARNEHTAGYLIGEPLLADHLTAGLDAIGLSCADYGREHLEPHAEAAGLFLRF